MVLGWYRRILRRRGKRQGIEHLHEPYALQNAVYWPGAYGTQCASPFQLKDFSSAAARSLTLRQDQQLSIEDILVKLDDHLYDDDAPYLRGRL